MKLNKKLLSIIAVAGVGVASVWPTLSTVYATTSKATVDFIAPTTAPDILNPDNPNDPVTPGQIDEGEETNQVGVLTLDYVSNFNFDTQKLSAKNETYYATNEQTPFAQVTDVRGTGEGWHLTAQLASFTVKTDETDETVEASLPGVSITLKNAQNATQAGDVNAAPITSQEVNLSADKTAATITTAEANKGMGSWITRWLDQDSDVEGNENVALHVPAAVATKGAHTADITWTLYNTPTGDEVSNTTTEEAPTP